MCRDAQVPRETGRRERPEPAGTVILGVGLTGDGFIEYPHKPADVPQALAPDSDILVQHAQFHPAQGLAASMAL